MGSRLRPHQLTSLGHQRSGPSDVELPGGDASLTHEHIGAGDDAVIEARLPVQPSVFDVLNIDVGQVGQWV